LLELQISIETMTVRRTSLLLDQLVTMIDIESIYTVPQPVPCQKQVHTSGLQQQQQRMDVDEWRRKICQWSFRVIDHLRM
jgi:hypothetical protein